MLKDINWIAVIVAVVLLEVLGFLWYGVVFEARWLAALGHTPDMSNANTMMALGAVNQAIAVIGLAWLIRRLGADSVAAAVKVALAAWLFFNFTTMAIEYLYEGHTAELLAMNMAFQLIAYVLAAVVLALLKPKAVAAA